MLLPLSRILQLITPTILDNRRDVLRMMKWRIANQQSYSSQPNITEEGFRTWLIKHVFGKERLLFWVLDHQGKKIGHMGLYRFTKNSCEIDNVLRGEKGNKGRMSQALQHLIKWTFKNVPIANLYLRVLSTNTSVIEFYKKNGFSPLRKVIVRKGNSLRFLKMKYES